MSIKSPKWLMKTNKLLHLTIFLHLLEQVAKIVKMCVKVPDILAT